MAIISPVDDKCGLVSILTDVNAILAIFQRNAIEHPPELGRVQSDYIHLKAFVFLDLYNLRLFERSHGYTIRKVVPFDDGT